MNAFLAHALLNSITSFDNRKRVRDSSRRVAVTGVVLRYLPFISRILALLGGLRWKESHVGHSSKAPSRP